MTPRQRKVRAALLTLGGMTVCGGWAAHYNWQALQQYAGRQYRFYRHRTGPDGLYKDLYSGRVRAGDPVEEFVATRPPDQAVHVRGYTVLTFGGMFEGVTVVAKDGRLAYAGLWSCRFADVFFNTLTPAEMATFDGLYQAEKDRLRETRRAAALAVAGFGATFDPRDLPQPPPEPEP